MLQLREVSAGYGQMSVLHKVSIMAKAGRITALIGSNGAGKSTTLKAIVNSVAVFGGATYLQGEPLNGLSTNEVVARGISLVPEGRKIFSRLTVMENLRVGSYVCSDTRQITQRIKEIFDLFPRLAERRNEMGAALSGGEQQMLAIGRGLMSSPKVLLLDEPSMGLAPILADQVFQAIDSLRTHGCTILLVEQNASRTLALADEAYVLQSGRVVMEGTGNALAANQSVIEAYLGG